MPTGEHVAAVRVTQVPFGPDNLELLTRSGDRLCRWYWTAEQGFVGGGRVARGAAAGPTPIVAVGAALHTIVPEPSEQVVHYASTVTEYPSLSWERVAAFGATRHVTAVDFALDPSGTCAGLIAATVDTDQLVLRVFDEGAWRVQAAVAGQWRSVRLVVAPTGDRHVFLLSEAGDVTWVPAPAEGGWPEPRRLGIRCDSLAAAWSGIDGGRMDMVTRHATALRHHTWVLPATFHPTQFDVMSAVWLDAPHTPVHRQGTVAKRGGRLS